MTHLVVIGHAGQLACELRSLPLPAGWRLSSLDRAALDLIRPESFEASLARLAPDVIINAAGHTAVDRAEAEADLAMLVNGHAPGQIARVALQLGAPLLHLSTDYVFDGRSAVPYTEHDVTNPVNGYGRSKLAGERAILETGARAVILRTSWMFGQFGGNFVRTMLELATQRAVLEVVCDQHGGPTPARDVAATLVSMAQRLVDVPDSATGIFHYSGSPPTTWAGFAGAIIDAAGWLSRKPYVAPVPTSQFPTAAARPPRSVLDCSKLQRTYGIEQPDWHAGLARTLHQLGPDLSRNTTS